MSSLEDTGGLVLSASVRFLWDAIVSVDAHLRTCPRTVPVAKQSERAREKDQSESMGKLYMKVASQIFRCLLIGLFDTG